CTPAVVLRVLVRAALQQFLRGLARFGARFGERCLRGAYQRRHAPFVDGVDTRAFGQQQPHGAFAVSQRRVVQRGLVVLVADVRLRLGGGEKVFENADVEKFGGVVQHRRSAAPSARARRGGR